MINKAKYGIILCIYKSILYLWGRKRVNNSINLFTNNIFDVKTAITETRACLLKKDQIKLENLCKKLPKPRTYNLISEFAADKSYLSKPLSFVQRKFLAKLRLGVLPIRIETGRYERPRKTEAERVCKQCSLSSPECGEFIMEFSSSCYSQLRAILFSKISVEEFPNRP
jgi:hypothetical protein